MKRAGWDGVVIRGKSDRLSYIFVDDDVVEIKDATQYEGKTTWEVEDLIKEELKDESVRVASIGSAGEKMVRFACITNAKNRHIGRNRAIGLPASMRMFTWKGGWGCFAQPTAETTPKLEAMATERDRNALLFSGPHGLKPILHGAERSRNVLLVRGVFLSVEYCS